MEENIRQCALRLLAMREIRGYSEEYMADKTGVTPDEYRSMERGERDFSLGFLLAAANTLEMDLAELVTGEQSKLDFCAITRKGDGLAMSRRKAYSYKHLAYNFKRRLVEPFVVTVTDDAPRGTREAGSHETQEFVYVIEGTIELQLDGMPVILETGDSAYFDSTKPHVFYTHDCPQAKFLTIVIKGGNV